MEWMVGVFAEEATTLLANLHHYYTVLVARLGSKKSRRDRKGNGEGLN